LYLGRFDYTPRYAAASRGKELLGQLRGTETTACNQISRQTTSRVTAADAGAPTRPLAHPLAVEHLGRTCMPRHHSTMVCVAGLLASAASPQLAASDISSFTGNPHSRCSSASVRVLPRLPSGGWLGSRVVSVLDSGAEGSGFKSQPRRCRVTVLGKLFTPVVPLFTKQRNW